MKGNIWSISRILKCFLLTAMVFSAVLAGGCKISKDDGKKVRDLEFTVAADSEVPAELKQIITEKTAQPFKLTFSDEQNLYIVVGYGSQSTGGYSIAVNALYLTSNSIVIDTELLGPAKGENPAPETSYPYVVVKTENLENPVIFQ